MDNNTEIYKELQPGTPLNAGKYVIEKKIGEGGFGITYRAVQQGLNRAVCIKEYFLAGRCVRNTVARTIQLQGISEEKYEKYRQAFVKEAQTLATLHHPNIVEVIDVFDENGTSYMAMPFIEGRSLQSIVEKNGPLAPPDAINYMAQITNAVGYIHDRHILHRDIKPENIMITADFRAILIDFGSARQFEQDKTQMHTSMLTHGYAPTEQYTANSRKGSYTDIYAIGATLYFILTGHVPLEAAARLTEKMQEPKELNPDIPDEINRTILKAMQLKAENRHQTVQEFMDDLLNVKPSELVDETIGGGTVVVEKKVVVEKTKKWMWWVVGAAAAIIAILGLTIGINMVQHQKKNQANRENEIHVLDSTYHDSQSKFEDAIKDFNKPNILTDEDHVKRALGALKKIEKCENNDLFYEIEGSPNLQKNIAEYKQKLLYERQLIENQLSTYTEEQIASGYGYIKDLNEKKQLIDDILNQMSDQSVSQVHLKPTQRNENQQ